MFVQNLDGVQKQALLALTKKVVAADGVVHDKQKSILDFFNSQCTDADLSQETDFEDDKLVETFPDQRSQVSLLLELLGVAYANQAYHDEERRVVEQVASEFPLSPELVEEMEAWVHRQMILAREAELMMEA